jgi:hypothetical protein
MWFVPTPNTIDVLSYICKNNKYIQDSSALDFDAVEED